MGLQGWARATAKAFEMLRGEQCAEVAKPEWWNDEELKALSVRVVKAAPNYAVAILMRALVLSGTGGVAWGRGLARQRSSRRRPRTSGGLRRCTLLRRRKPRLPFWRIGAAARQRPCSGVNATCFRVFCDKRHTSELVTHKRLAPGGRG